MKRVNFFERARRRVACLAVAGVFAACGMTVFIPRQAAAEGYGSCDEVSMPVALAPGQAKDYRIRGRHCSPSSPSIVHSIDVLIPGGTYSSTYWDFPYDNWQYSYVDRTIQAGRATFNFDRIGTGESSKPLSTLITYETEVYTLHQVIQFLKNTYNYTDVTTVGHSAGAIVAVKEAAVYKDVNRLVATGFLHSPGIKLILGLGAGGLYPAILDPQFASKGLDPLYLTTIPGKRGPAFYSSAADPTVIAYDEAHKDIISGNAAAGAIAQALTPPLLNSSRNVTVPVLTIVGDQDVLCNALIGVDCSNPAAIHSYEKPYYPKAKSFTTKVVPNTGHNLPLHPSADESFNTIDTWIESN